MKRTVINKKVGETPLEALERFRAENPELKDVPITYAGRLDPMAEGKLLLLVGEECKKKDFYNKLDKEYEFEVLLGFKSDSGDILGLADFEGDKKDDCVLQGARQAGEFFLGHRTFRYPLFSSKTFSGKPLFQHARRGSLSKDEAPVFEAEIYGIDYLGKRTIAKKELIENILNRINLLKINPNNKNLGSDFRKEEIIGNWQKLEGMNWENATILKYKVAVSSGAYIRVLAPLVAQKLNTSGLAYSIKRTRLGKYFKFFKNFGVWLRELK